MKKEHYAHISNRFNLERYCYFNRYDIWGPSTKGTVSVPLAFVRYEGREKWRIAAPVDRILFCWLPSKTLADEVLHYIKDTEILFL